MKKLSLALALTVSLSLVLAAACGGASPTPAPTVTVTKSPTPAPTVTVTATPTPTATPVKTTKVITSEATGGSQIFYWGIGKEQGYYQKRGIDVEVKEMAAAAARVAPVLGQADVSTGGILQVLEDIEKGVPTRIIGPNMTAHYSFTVQKDSPYKSVADLKGKKVAMGGPATALYRMAKLTLRLYGIDMEKDFILVHGDAPVISGWIEKGEVDATLVWEPYSSKLIATGKVRELAFLSDLYKAKTGEPLMVGGVYTHAIWAKEHPDVAKQLGLAHGEAYKYTVTHPEVWKSDLAKTLWKVDDPAVLELLVQRMPRISDILPYTSVYKVGLERQVRLAVEAGVLTDKALEWIKDAVLFAD